MNKLFLKTYFYLLLALSIISVVLLYFVDLHEVYTQITYHTDVIPAVLVTGMFAFLCFLSFVITGICVRKWGNTPMKFSWGNSVFFVLFGLLCIFIVWQSPKETTLVDYVAECYSDLILLAASGVVAVTLASGVAYIIRQAKSQPTEEVSVFKNWYSIFMLLTLLMSLVYLLIGVLSFERGFDRRETFFYMLFIGGTILAVSLITALLSVSGSMLMEKNKPMAFMMSILTAIVFFIPHAWCMYNTIISVTYMQIGMPRPDYFGAVYQPYEPKEAAEVREEEAYAGEEEPEDGIYYEGLAELASLQHYNPLWYNSESPEDSIASMFEGMKSKIRPTYLIYHLNIPTLDKHDPEEWGDYYYIGDRGDMLFLKACHYISQNRLEIPLDDMVKAYLPFIQSVITNELFEEEKIGRIIKWLNYAYIDIDRRGDSDQYSDRFELIYNIMSEDLSEDSDRYSKYYNKLAKIANLPEVGSDDYVFSFSDEYKAINEEVVVWAYSFWARRWKEGTVSKAWEVLDVIEECYIRGEYD